MRKIPAKNNRRDPRLLFFTTLGIIAFLLIVVSGFKTVRYALARFTDGFFYPYMQISKPSSKLSDSTLLLQDKGTLAARVEKLTGVNRELALRANAAAELLEENRKLRRILNLQYRSNPSYTIAEIMLRDPLHFRDGFTISKGSRDGIVKGAAVVDVNIDGQPLLIGVISEVGARTSKVMTILNHDLRISGMVSSNQEIGFTNGGTPATDRNRIRFGMLPVRGDYINTPMVLLREIISHLLVVILMEHIIQLS
jgi:cell shape-determining protein MreC